VDSSLEVSGVSVHLRSARLKRADVELLDVPLTRRQDEPFADPGSLLQGCPAAFLLVAASSLITRWEQDLMREAFVRQFFSFLAVGVVGLRLVAEEDRGDVLASIRRTVRAIDPSLEVVVEDEATGPDREPVIGRLLESLFSRADVRFLRQSWLNRNLAVLLDELEILLRERERGGRLTDHDRSRELRQAEQDRDETEAAAWLDARLELRRRRASLVDQIQREIGDLQSSALPQLRAEMKLASDAKRWATDRMAAAIREFFVDSVHQIDRQIRNSVERDSDWLLSLFPGLAGELPQAVQPLVLHDDYIRMPYMDLQVFAAGEQEAGIRSAAQQAIPAVSARLNVPVPDLNLLYSIATATLDRNQERKERDEVGSLLSQTFRRAASRFAEDADEYVMTVYKRLESQVQRSVQALLDNKFKALRKQDRRSAKELSAIRDGVERIRSALRAYPGAFPERKNDHG
jgi:hypothetical protein